MKNSTLLIACITTFFTINTKAQTVSTIDNLTLQTDTFWDGSDMTGGFASGNAYFLNSYQGYWASGWVYSNKTDSATVLSDYLTQLYIGKAGAGYLSSNYAIGTQGAITRLTGQAAGGVVNGVYVTNNDYAYNSMALGDAFAKKFGGTTGSDADWFKLTVRKYYQGVMTNDSVEFYLADFRFQNNSQDYLVRNLSWLDLTPLGNVDSLAFFLTSTDNGSFGMNTPAYFCVDDLTTANSPLSIEASASVNFSMYPVPANNHLTIKGENLAGSSVAVYAMTGQKISETILLSDVESISLLNLAPGVYNLVITSQEGAVIARKPFIHE